ncbi:MAG: hypothetical protein COA96_04030 [SAR86 cluster bacterium]|uniref:HTH tetR-type domain-containing protein n=1 Tax=SAR86 cluster bacterium TaxID=2030880 RepID=A0A2A5B703_9GAMM|nr:MAG: hypothetical protein COA96_04030 [SAR86 cluster bacterium]
MAEVNPQSIAAAALRIADENGVKGFTMRAVAGALNVTPMALYHHVKNKAALAALLIDSIIREHPLPPSTGDWQEDLWSMAQWARENIHAHPAVADIRRHYQIWTPSILQMTERWLSLWQQSGLEPDKALLAATSSSLSITGFVEEEMFFRTMPPPTEEMLSMLPNVRLMFDMQPDSAMQFELFMRSLIEGLYTRLSEQTS